MKYVILCSHNKAGNNDALIIILNDLFIGVNLSFVLFITSMSYLFNCEGSCNCEFYSDQEVVALSDSCNTDMSIL